MSVDTSPATQLPFACPTTGKALYWSSSGLSDESGQVAYPVVHGVPILAQSTAIATASSPVDPGFVSDLLTLAPHRDTAEVRSALSAAFSRRFSFKDPWLASEADQFIDRLRSSGLSLRDPYPRAASAAQTRLFGRCTIEPVVAPAQVPRNANIAFNIRITNGLSDTLKAEGVEAVTLVCETPDTDAAPPARTWRSVLGLERGAVLSKTTALLVDMEAGRTMAQPVHLPRLPHAGPLTLTFKLMRGDRQLASTTTAVEVIADGDPLEVDWKQGHEIRSYEQDHKLAFDVMVGWLDRLVGKPDPLVVEIGGNFGPMSYWWPGRRCNVDIDPYGLMAHTLLHGPAAPKPDGFVNALGDGMKLPFLDRSVDAIVMFATFHHFPDPVGFLRSLVPKLSEQGLVMLFCEPMGHVFKEKAPDDYIRELKHGAYEQSFMLWEYRAFFEMAGLDVVETHIDYGSMKVALKPRGRA